MPVAKKTKKTTGTKKTKKTTGTKKTKKTTGTRKPKKTTKRTKKTTSGTRTVVREVPVFVTNPFLPFRTFNTDVATNNLLGYMRGMVDGRNAVIGQGMLPINPLLLPTNTRRSARKPVAAPSRLRGNRGVAREILDQNMARGSRGNDTNSSVFRDLRRMIN
ncbi:unnamed protein product [Pylaiella littoralis]